MGDRIHPLSRKNIMTLNIYTDASAAIPSTMSCYSVIVPKKEAICVVTDNDPAQKLGSVQSEIVAVYLAAVRHECQDVTIHTDSLAVISLIEDKEIHQLNVLAGLKQSWGRPQTNWRMRFMADYLMNAEHITVQHVSAHKGHHWNETADFVANRGLRIHRQEKQEKQQQKQQEKQKKKRKNQKQKAGSAKRISVNAFNRHAVLRTYGIAGDDLRQFQEMNGTTVEERFGVQWNGIQKYDSINDMLLDFIPGKINERYPVTV